MRFSEEEIDLISAETKNSFTTSGKVKRDDDNILQKKQNNSQKVASESDTQVKNKTKFY